MVLVFQWALLGLSYLLSTTVICKGNELQLKGTETRAAETIASLCRDVQRAMTGHPITLLTNEQTDKACTFPMRRKQACHKGWESLVASTLWKLGVAYERMALNDETVSITKNIFIIGDKAWVTSTLSTLLSLKLLIYSHRVIVISAGTDNRKEIRSWLKNNIHIGISVVVATENPLYCSDKSISINCEGDSWVLEFISPQQYRSSILQTVGKWSEKRGLVKSSRQLYPAIDLTGWDLRVSLYNKNMNESLRLCHKWYRPVEALITEHTLSVLRYYLKSCFVTDFRPYSTIGSARPNGTWNGHIGLLMKDEIDIAGRIMVAISSRMEAVDLSEWFDIGTTHMLVAGPYPEEKPFIIFEVFRFEVWLTIMGAILAGSGIKWMIAHAERSIQRSILKRQAKDATTFMYASSVDYEDESLTDQPINVSFPHHFFMIFRMTCMEPTIENSTWLASRVLHMMLWFTFISMCAGYSGNITSFMAIPHLHKPINSLMDLVNSPQVTPMVRAGNAHANYLKSAATNATKLLYARMMKTPDQSFVRWGVTKTIVAEICASGKSAYIASKSYCTTAKDQNPNLYLHVATEPIKWDLYTFGLQKNSPYQERVNLGLKRIKQHGINLKITSDYYFASATKGIFQKQNSNQNGGAASLVFQLKHLQGAFYLLFTGLTLAFIRFIMELIA